MKKSPKVKKSKGSSKRSAAEETPELPSLVTAMTKFVERLEVLERKMDQVLGRVSNLPSEMRHVVENFQRPSQPHYNTQQPAAPRSSHQSPLQGEGEGRKERTMYKAVCADCHKGCEVPFRPTEERPVYCKECFAIRKAGHRSQDPDRRSVVPPQKRMFVPPPMDYRPPHSGNVAVLKGGKKKHSHHAGAKPKKKR